MSRGNDLLFYEGDLFDTLRHRQKQISSKVDVIPKDQFLATSGDDLLEHIYSSNFHVEPIVLYEDRMEKEQHETKVNPTTTFS